MPVVKTCPLDSLIGNVKAQRPDQVKGASGSGAGSGDVAAILGNLGFHQYDMEHAFHLEIGWYKK